MKRARALGRRRKQLQSVKFLPDGAISIPQKKYRQSAKFRDDVLQVLLDDFGRIRMGWRSNRIAASRTSRRLARHGQRNGP